MVDVSASWRRVNLELPNESFLFGVLIQGSDRAFLYMFNLEIQALLANRRVLKLHVFFFPVLNQEIVLV